MCSLECFELIPYSRTCLPQQKRAVKTVVPLSLQMATPRLEARKRAAHLAALKFGNKDDTECLEGSVIGEA